MRRPNADLARLLTGPRWRIGLRDLDALGRRAALLVRDEQPAPADGAAAAPLQVGGDEAEVGALSDVLEQLDDLRLRRAAPLSAAAEARLRRLRDELASLRRRASQPLPDLIADVERTTGLDIELEASPAALRSGRRANVLAFLDVAAEFVGLEGQTDLGAFLASLEAAEKAEDGYDIGVPSASDAVKLMTVHSAKGLEWDIVAVPGLSRGVFPSGKRDSPWPHRAAAIPGELRGDRDDLPVWTDPSKKGWDAFKDAVGAVLAAEERRLAYVAVTRARDVLLCSGYWWSATAKRVLSPPSDFFVEIEEACAQGAGIVEDAAPAPLEGETNPLLSAERSVDVSWPPPPVVPEGMRWAAKAVEGYRTDGEVAPPVPAAASDALSETDLQRITAWQRDAELLLRERQVARSRRDILLPGSLSVSDIVDVATDPAAYARRLSRPVPQPPAPAARQGTSFHAWVEQRAGSRALLGPEDLPGAGDESLAVAGDDLRALQDAFLSTSWASREPVAVEVGFELVLAGALVRGRIDAVYATDDGGFDVIDYKTGARPSGQAAMDAAIQLACYRAAWAEIAGVPPERVGAAFLYVREGETGLLRPALRTRDELIELLAAVPAGPE